MTLQGWLIVFDEYQVSNIVLCNEALLKISIFLIGSDSSES